MATEHHADSNARGAKRRHRAGSHQSEPYKWLGAGAVTLGLGVVLASGSGIAHADDAGSTSSSSSITGSVAASKAAGSESAIETPDASSSRSLSSSDSPESGTDGSSAVAGSGSPSKSVDVDAADTGAVDAGEDAVSEVTPGAVIDAAGVGVVVDIADGAAADVDVDLGGASGADDVSGADESSESNGVLDAGSSGTFSSSDRSGASGSHSVDADESAPVAESTVAAESVTSVLAPESQMSMSPSSSSSGILSVAFSTSPDEGATAPIPERTTPVAESTPIAEPAKPSSWLGSLLSKWLGSGRQASDGGPVAPAAAPLMWGAAAVARRELGSTAKASATAAGRSVGLFGDGTAEHPDGGLLFGNGFNWDSASCTGGKACDGGNAGLWGGKGGNGFNGGDGGSGGLFGHGGDGGAGVPGGNGGNGGAGGSIFGTGGNGGKGGVGLAPHGAGGKGGDGGKRGLFGTSGQRGDDGAAAPNATPTAKTSVGKPNSSSGVVTGAVTASDADGDALTYKAPATTSKGKVTITNAGVFTYTPTTAAREKAGASNATAAVKKDTFTVTVTDGHGGSLNVPINVTVLGTAQTLSQKVATFVSNTKGKKLANAQGTYAGECVSLVSQYLKQVWGVTTNAWGNAVNYAPSHANSSQAGKLLSQSKYGGFTWHGPAGAAQLKDGDILVFGANSAAGKTGPNGHIGIWSKGQLYDQNNGWRPGTKYNSSTRQYDPAVAGYSPYGVAPALLGYWRK